MADQPLTDEEMRGLFGDGGDAPGAPAPSAAPTPAPSSAAPPILSPEEERALFPPTAPQPGQQEVRSLADPGALEAFQAATLRGIGNVAGGVQRLFGFEPTLAERTNRNLTAEQVNALGIHPWAAATGTALGQTAATAPVMLAGGALAPSLGAASGPALLLRGAGYGALTGGTQNVLTSGDVVPTSGDSPAPMSWTDVRDRFLQGAPGGAIFGAGGGLAEVPLGAGQRVSADAQAAGRQLQGTGVDILPANLPRSTGGALDRGAPPTIQQSGQINQAWGKIYGQNTPDFKPATNDASLQRLGTDVDNTVRQGELHYDVPLSGGKTFQDKLAEIEADNPGVPAVKRIVDGIISKVDAAGKISGDDVANIIQHGNLLDRSTRSRVGEVASPANEIEALVKEGFNASSPTGVGNAYSLARERYKLALVGENAADPITGNIDPAKLTSSFEKFYPDAQRIGGGTSLSDRGANLARNTTLLFGGQGSAAPPLARGGWLTGPLSPAAAGVGAIASTYLPHALPEAVRNPFVAGAALAAPLLGHAGRNLLQHYQSTPSFANALINRPGRAYLSTLGGSVGGPALAPALGGAIPAGWNALMSAIGF